MGRKPAAKAPGQAERSYVAGKYPFSISTGFRGEIAPGESVAVIAPFDGILKRLHFAYGDRVEAGQLLAEFDTADVQRSRNEAESAYLKSAQSAAQFQDWENGPEMSRARRGLTNATLDLQQAERRLAETKVLFDRGLVARMEYENQQQQIRSQRMAVEAAEQELRLTAERGRGSYRRVAALDLDNSSNRLSTVSADMSGARVIAPDAGIIVMPPAAGQAKPDSAIAVGARLTKGQPLGIIAKAGALGVRFQLDESDVNAIKIGQAVTVTGAGFAGPPLKGRIHSIAGQAAGDGASSGKATFVAMALLDAIPAEQARQVRIGMTANLNITAYTNPSVIVLPLQAIQDPSGNPYVLVQVSKRKPPRQTSVKLGKASATHVEILSGLVPGQRVVWTEAVASVPSL